jgi:hypothetical protein
MIGSDFLNAAIFAENLSASATAMGGTPATQLGDPERSWSSIATPFGGLTSKAISSTSWCAVFIARSRFSPAEDKRGMAAPHNWRIAA